MHNEVPGLCGNFASTCTALFDIMISKKLSTVSPLFLLVVGFMGGFIVTSIILRGFQAREDTEQQAYLKEAHTRSLSKDLTSRGSEMVDVRVMERQTARKALMKEYCKRMDRHSTLKPRCYGAFMCHNILYCVTPKCASRQITTMLHHALSGNRQENLGDLSPDQQNKVLSTFFKFTFVREPFERLLSAYKDKFLHPTEGNPLLNLHGKAILKNIRPNASERALEKLNDITFKEFIQYIVTNEGRLDTNVMNWHWDNYENICSMCTIDYDFIGHFETFHEDLLALKAAVGKDINIWKILKPDGYNMSKTSSELLKYYSQIPPEWIKTLGVIYNSSFELFNYSFPGPLKSLLQK